MGAYGAGFGIYRDATAGSSDITGSGTVNRIAKFTAATVIGDSAWVNVGDHIYPFTTGSNIGQAANRIGTIFMSSTLDYSADLVFSSGGTTMTLTTGGSLGIGVSPVASAILQADSTTKGFLVPRMDETQKDAIVAPATGLLVYQTDVTDGFYYYDGSAWVFNDPTNIYNTSSSLLAAREVTLGTFALNFALTNASGDFSVGPASFAASTSIHLKAFDTGGTTIEGSSGTSGTALTVRNSAGSIINSTYTNSGDANLGVTNTTITRGRVNVGTSTAEASTKLTVRGRTSTSTETAAYIGGSTGTLGVYVSNDERFGVGALGATSEKVNIRGTGATSATSSLTIENSGAALSLNVRDDRLVQIQTTGVGSGGFTSKALHSSTTETSNVATTSVNHAIAYTPSVSGAGRVLSIFGNAFMQGANNASEVTGVSGQALVNGATGTITTMRGGFFKYVHSSGASTVTNAWGLETDTANPSVASTYTNFGGVNVQLTSSTNATITNMYGLKVQSPANTGGSTITNTYGVRVLENTAGTNNYGVYIEGTGTESFFEGSLGVGTLSLSTTEALLELVSTDKAFLIMRMTAAQATAITAVDGMMLYVSDTDATFTSVGFWGYQAGAWLQF